MTACGGDDSATPADPLPAPLLSISGNSGRAIAGGAAVTLTATPSYSSTVSSALAAGNPGSLSASSGANTCYQPPASVSANTQITITASANGVNKSFTLPLCPADYPRLELQAGDDGGLGRIDGTGTAARLNVVHGFSSDASGNLYLAEDGPALRKVTPARVVTTLLATTPGYVDGTKGTAKLNTPGSPVAGPDGSVYFTDTDAAMANGVTHKALIRKLAPDGSISTVAQFTLAPFDTLRLAADSKQLYAYQPEQISTGSFGGVVAPLSGVSSVDGANLVAGLNNTLYAQHDGQIDAMQADGTTTPFAGKTPQTTGDVDGAGSAAHFTNLALGSIDADGNLYGRESDATSGTWRSTGITPAGVVTSISALPITPGVMYAAGNTYSIDQGLVMRTTPAGATSIIAGTPGRNLTYGGDLPGSLEGPSHLTKTGPYRFALFSGRPSCACMCHTNFIHLKEA
ncbi:hypothetical protein GTP44_14305 [Duganella sp. FT50W]|uniref:Uncharacterized protein n=1 Tax=Duganella lactea TaxID=2692173 RepID=A0A6L8MKG1_9BURK|nr:hypothetical protein [Duganella lactea]MYM83124.1 hypothetical protein [Duganella lactea]